MDGTSLTDSGICEIGIMFSSICNLPYVKAIYLARPRTCVQ